MKTSLSICLFFVLISETAFSQNRQDYIYYHQSCRNAEKFFIDSDYTHCFKTYDSVFNAYDFLFPRDCYIAAQLAFKTGRDSLSVEYLKKAVPFGFNHNFILNDTSFLINKIKTNKFWNSYIHDYDSLRKLYINRVDWKLKDTILKMVRIDQQWRIKNNKWFNRNFRKGLEKKFEVDNRKHIHFFDSIFIIKGYPGIWLTGVGDSNDIPCNNNDNLTEIFPVIFYHYHSAYTDYADFLRREVLSGHIHTRTYAMITDFHDRFAVKKDKDQKMYYNIWWEAKNYSEQEYEQHCREIGCPSKNHMRALNKAAGRNIEVYRYPLR